MGETLSKIGRSIKNTIVHICMSIIDFFNPIIYKTKERSKQNQEDKDQNKFQRDHRQEREIMNYYQRGNQKYNKMYDRLRDYDDDNFDYY